MFVCFSILFPGYIFIHFRERGKEREKEQHQCERETLDSLPPTYRGSNPQPFGAPADTSTNLPGLYCCCFYASSFCVLPVFL